MQCEDDANDFDRDGFHDAAAILAVIAYSKAGLAARCAIYIDDINTPRSKMLEPRL